MKTRNIILGISAAAVTTAIVTTSGTGNRNYYFSGDGDDGNSGSVENPMKSISKASSLTNADTIFLDGEFFGTFKPATAGVVVSSHNGATITGFKNVNEWRNLGNNLWESVEQVSNLSYINLVVKDGVPVHKGRYPNEDASNGGYLKISSHSGKTSITDNTLPSGFEIPTGSEIVIRCKQWVIDRNKVKSKSGNTIYYDYNTATYEPENGGGYFLQNAVKFCNKNGEWYYNPGTHKLTMYSTSEPANIKVAAIESLLNTQGKSNVKVENINFEGANGDAIVMGSSQNFSMNNVNITYAGHDGFTTNMASNNVRLTNIKIQHCLNMGIETNCNDIHIENFKVSDISLLTGHGENGDGSKGTAISFRNFSNNAKLLNGEIRRSGNCGFSWKGLKDAQACNDLLVRNVVCDSALLQKSDQGAFYGHVGTLSHPKFYNRVFEDCTISNALGNKNGTVKNFNSGFGFYGDIGSTDIELRNVKIINCGRAGLLLNYGAQRWIIKNCTFSNNGNGMGTDTRGCQVYIQESDTRRVGNIIFKDNIIEASVNRKLIYVDNSTGYQTVNIGTADSNHYIVPLSYASSAFVMRTKAGIKKKDFTAWKAIGYDINGKLYLK